MFWCWSRRDYNEKDLRQLPITLDIREEIFTSFNASFLYNQSNKSIKCNSHEEWAENWIDVSDPIHPPTSVPCFTNISAVGYFEWDPYPNKL